MNVVSFHTEQSSPHHWMKDRDWWSWLCDSDMHNCTTVGEADSTAPWFQRDSTEPL